MAGPTISSITVLTATVPVNGLFEATCAISGSYANPFDPDTIALEGRFVDPNGVPHTPFPGFWTQLYTATGRNNTHGELYATSGSAHWRQRFRPTIVGTWSFQLVATTPGGTTISASNTFVCTGALSPNPHLSPWVVNSNNLYTFEDGHWFAPVGHNYAFDDRDYTIAGTAGADDFLTRMAAAGANTTRIWMHPFYGSDLEEFTSGATMYSGWDNHYTGNAGQDYNLIAGWVMDYRLQKAMDQGLSVILVLQAQGPFSTESDSHYTDNPYDSANGGPLDSADPTTLFTSGTALAFYQRRWRYILARYGAYASVGLIEVGTDMGHIGTSGKDGYLSSTVRGQMGGFIDAMIDYWNAMDPWTHLWTWSQEWEQVALGGPPGLHFDNIALDSRIAVGQLHRYHDSEQTKNGDVGTAYDILTDYEARIGKPILYGERGLFGAPEPNFDPTTSSLTDVQISHLLVGTAFHNDLWFNLVVKTRWGGYFWWGSYLRDDSTKHRSSGTRHGVAWAFPLDAHYAGVAAFLAGEDLSSWGPIRDITKTMVIPVSLFGGGMADATHAWVWLRDALNRYDSGILPSGMTYAGLTIAEPFWLGGLASLTLVETYGLGHPAAQLTLVEKYGVGLSSGLAVEPFDFGVVGLVVPTPTITIRGMADGAYDVEVWNTLPGDRVTSIAATSAAGTMVVTLPSIDRDVALKISQGGIGGTPLRAMLALVEGFNFGAFQGALVVSEPFTLGALLRASLTLAEPFSLGLASLVIVEPFDLGSRVYLAGSAPASPKLGWRDR